MSTTTNELIAVIDECRGKGMAVKAVRKQKFDPSNFYMTRSDGRQLGPIHCAGDAEELNRKLAEAVEYLDAMKRVPKRAA